MSDLSDLEGFGLAWREHCAPGCLQCGAGRRRGQRYAVARELLKPTNIDELDPVCVQTPSGWASDAESRPHVAFARDSMTPEDTNLHRAQLIQDRLGRCANLGGRVVHEVVRNLP